ncbi:MAG: glycosyltransferase family 39 protein [Thermomicrobiales bacterium]
MRDDRDTGTTETLPRDRAGTPDAKSAHVPATPVESTDGKAVTVVPAASPAWRAVLLRYGLPLLVTAVLALAALWPRASFSLNVGAPGDRLFLAGVHGDERVAGYSYRWTGKGSDDTTLTVPGWAAVSRLRLTLRAQALPERAPVTVSILAGGEQVGALTLDGTMATHTTDIALPAGASSGDTLTLTLRAPAAAMPGDSRTIGVKLDSVQLAPLAYAPATYWRTVWPPLLGALILTALLLALIGNARGRPALVVRGAAVLVVPMAFTVPLPWSLALLPAGIVAAALAALARYARRLGALGAAGWAALGRPRVATGVVAAGLALYVAMVLPHLLAVPWINHADYADNAVVARNLVRGQGFTVDYIAQFYRAWPAPHHPADTWPPLQPLMIAASFAIFGVSVGTAKLPNLVVMVALLWLVFRVGRRLWSPRVGLLAAVILAANPDLFEGVVYPLNDVAFTLLSFGCLALLWRVVSADRDGPQGLWRVRWAWALLGVLGGLLILCKPSGAVILAGGAVWALWTAWRGGVLRSVAVGGAIAAVVAALVWLPWGIRNLLVFGVPFYSTESYDAWILGYQNWEVIYRAYAGRLPLPHPRLLVGYGFDTVSGKILTQFRDAWGDLKGGVILPASTLLPVIGGLLVFAGRRRWSIFGCLAAATVPYALFVLVYWHYESRYTLYLLPWGALLAGAGLCWLADRLAAARGQARATLVLIAALVIILAPQVATLADDWQSDLRTPSSVVVADWIRANTPASAIIMTRNPWELSFHSDRQAVMIPTDDLATIEASARPYHVTYLQLDHLNSAAYRRAALGPLYAGPENWQGFQKVYDRRGDDGEGLLVYTFPDIGR